MRGLMVFPEQVWVPVASNGQRRFGIDIAVPPVRVDNLLARTAPPEGICKLARPRQASVLR
jgi:hypothetical protein